MKRKLIAQLMANNNGGNLRQALLDSAPFRSSLTYTAVPQSAASGTTGTFTRATTKTIENNDGYLVTLLAGEIGFPGARRVRNLCTVSSEVMTSANGWTATNCAQVKNLTGPDGVDNSAYTLTASAGNALFYNGAAAISAPSTAACFSVYLKRVTGTGTIQISADGANTLSTVTLTSDWTRFSVVKTGTGSFGVIKIVTNGDAIGVARWQLEDVTAQTTQTAGEYVSVGVESAPYYHGSMVDGVKCYSTDINGSPIPSSTLLGYQAEGARTNLCLQSNAFTTTWAALNGGTATQDTVGPDGATSAWTFTDANAVAFAGRRQTFVIANDSIERGVSLFVKKTSGATTFPGISISLTGGTAIFASMAINTNTGVVTARTGETPTNSSITSFNSNYWRVFISKANNSTGNTALTLDLMPAVNADASATWDAATQGTAVFFGSQLESGVSFPSSYIATTTIAVARNADVLTYSSAGNISTVAGWAYAEVTSNVTAGTQIDMIDLVASGNPFIPMLVNAGNNLGLLDPSVTFRPFNAMTPRPFTTPVDFVSTWAASGTTGTYNGAAPPALQTYTTGAVTNAIAVGIRADGSVGIFGTIRNVRIGQRQLSASELQTVTA